MSTKLVNLRLLLQSLTLVLVAAFSESLCSGQAIRIPDPAIPLKAPLIRLAPPSSQLVHVQLTNEGEVSILIEENATWWNLATEDGAKHLQKLLENKARLRVESHRKLRSLTPEQLEKLKIAAGVQVARDCRAIQKLFNTCFEANREKPINGVPQLINDENGFYRTSLKIGELIEAGVDRKNSLFVKVLNNLSE